MIEIFQQRRINFVVVSFTLYIDDSKWLNFVPDAPKLIKDVENNF